MIGIDCNNIFEQLPGYIGWKDMNFRHLGCNRNLAQILKLKSASHILGLTDDELIGTSEALSKFHRENDMVAMSGKTVKAFHQSLPPYDGSCFYFTKKPILDNENNITGLIYYCQKFESKLLHTLASRDKKYFLGNAASTYYLGVDTNNPFKLSVRELETLFYLLRGKTAKQIAEITRLSKRTIEAYIEQIKNKSGCDTKANLLASAISNGYMSIIPPQFLQNESYNVVN